MGIFFDGRLWTTPATMSLVEDSAMYNKNLSVGNVVALIGSSEGGQPKKPLYFGSASEARAVLRGGELLTACEKAFDPSAQTKGPALVIAFRANPASRAGVSLKDASNSSVIDIASTDFGTHTQNIRVQVEAISNGRRISITDGDKYSTSPIIDHSVMTIKGPVDSKVTIDSNSCTLLTASTSDIDVALDFEQHVTVGDLAAKINSISGWTCTVIGNNDQHPTLDSFDYLTNSVSDGANGVTVKATLNAIINWINSSSEIFCNARRRIEIGGIPEASSWQYLSYPSVTNTWNNDDNGEWSGSITWNSLGTTATIADYQACFDLLALEDVQWVCPITGDSSIHAMADTHCTYMSNVARRERRAIVGTPLATSDIEAIDLAFALNSDRTSLVHIGHSDYSHSGIMTAYPAYMTAALLTGMFSGVNPGTPLTNKTIKVRKIERLLRNPTDTDALINGGVLCIEKTNKGYKVVKSISTWLVNKNYNRVEVSCGVATDFTARNVREIVDDLRGQKNTPQLMGMAVSRAETTLRALAKPEPVGPGVLAGDKDNPAYKNITARIEGDVLYLEFECSPVIPCNYIPVIIHVKPYEGSVSI